MVLSVEKGPRTHHCEKKDTSGRMITCPWERSRIGSKEIQGGGMALARRGRVWAKIGR